MYTLEQIYEALGKIENNGTDGALKNLIATLTALQNAGGALSTLDTQMNGLKFQSTLLMRGATTAVVIAPTASFLFQSTLLMRGATVSLLSIDLLDFIIHFSRTQHLFPKTLLLTLCPVSSISCVMALRA